MKKIFSLFAAVLFCTSMFAGNVYFVNADAWTAVNAYMWADGNKENAAWPGLAMTKTSDKAKGFDVYSYEVPAGFSNLIFNNGNNAKTADLVYDEAKPYFYANVWYATLADVEAAGAKPKFYVTGETLVGAWNPNKLPVYEESVTIPNLEANKEYAFKVTVDGTWNTAKGYSELTDKTNLKGAGDNNVVFALKEAGAVTIKYTATEFTVTGNFVEKTVDPNVKFYITGETLVGSWNPDKLPVTSESYTFEDLAAGTYAFAITVDGTWATKKGFSDLTNKTNLTTDKDGNVVFTLTTIGDVTVKYTGTEFTVTGDIAPIEPTLTDGYYLIGDKYEWIASKLTAAQLFAQTDQEGEYKLEITLTEGEKIKVAKVEADAVVAWYPNNDYNYTVDANHAGLMTIYFRPAGSAEEAWAAFGGNMYIEPQESTAISNTAVESKAVKSIVNGMLVIEKAGVRYNVMGQIVK